MSPDRIVVGVQSAFARLWEATYFGSPFIFSANGSSGSVICGQSLAKLSYVRRPKSSASAAPSHVAASCTNASSRNGTNHPPWVNPSLVSSSGDPGLCDTPSTERNCVNVSLIVHCPLLSFPTPFAGWVYYASFA